MTKEKENRAGGKGTRQDNTVHHITNLRFPLPFLPILPTTENRKTWAVSTGNADMCTAHYFIHSLTHSTNNQSINHTKPPHFS